MSTKQQSTTLDAKQLDAILTKMMETVSESRDQIFEIGEQSRADYDGLMQDLADVKRQADETINMYDQLESKARLARGRLAQVSKHFQNYNEEEIRESYEKANEIQVEMSTIREKEYQLKQRRNDIERRLRTLKETVEKAEKLVGQVNVVQNYLKGDLKKVGELIEDAKQKQTFGLKIIEAQEEERKRLSREIHDGPAQLLAHVLLGSEIVGRVQKEEGPEAATKELSKFRDMVKNALREVRRIIYDLRPMTLDDLGLVPTLEKYLTRIEEQYAPVNIQFRNIGEERRLPGRMEAALFRLIQEAVQNACKHAKADMIKVSMECRQDSVVLLVNDDGVGFDSDQERDDSFGLIGMKERVDVLEGQLTIKSEPGNGTLVIFQIPILEEEE